MKAIIDVDCVVADFVGAILSIAKDPDRLHANRWDWFADDYPAKTSEEIFSALKDTKFWSELSTITDANKGIAWLRGQGHQLLWVTTPYTPCFGWCDTRRDWLRKNFRIDQHKEPLVFLKEKYLVQADVIIDDLTENTDQYAEHNPKAICLLFGSELNRQLNREKFTWDQIMSMRRFYYGNTNSER